MRYLKITNFDVANGKGCRKTIFFSGCENHCKDCQQPETWNEENGYPVTNEIIDEFIDGLKNPHIAGATFSGGDPLYPKNRDGVAYIAKKIKEALPNKNIWCYTGYLFEDVKNLEVMKYVDVLVDGKFIPELKDLTLPYRGSKNQRVIDVQRSLFSNGDIYLID